MERKLFLLLAFCLTINLHANQDVSAEIEIDVQQEENIPSIVEQSPEPERACHCHCQHHNQAQEKDTEQRLSNKEVQQLAIATLANMAQGFINIGHDPHNPSNVANSVTTIVGNFANFVAHAMKDRNIAVDALLSDELFKELCKKVLILKAEQIKARHDNEA